MSKPGKSGLGTVQEEVVTDHPQAQQSEISTVTSTGEGGSLC